MCIRDRPWTSISGSARALPLIDVQGPVAVGGHERLVAVEEDPAAVLGEQPRGVQRVFPGLDPGCGEDPRRRTAAEPEGLEHLLAPRPRPRGIAGDAAQPFARLARLVG